ncbi:MAG: ABC transporter permease, partial [Planctomycetota bacterium]
RGLGVLRAGLGGWGLGLGGGLSDRLRVRPMTDTMDIELAGEPGGGASDNGGVEAGGLGGSVEGGAGGKVGGRVVIEPRPGWQPIRLKELWRYRELAWFFAIRNIQVKYKQSVLGIAWSVIQPLTTIVVFSVLFGVLMGRGREPGVAGVPYAVSTFAALLPWQMFATGVGLASSSVVAAQGMITKVYFPRLIVPLAPMLQALVEFGIALAVFALMVLGFHLFDDSYSFVWRWNLLVLPVLIGLALAGAFSIGLWFAAAGAIYRDFRLLVPYVVQTLFFVTPVIYAADVFKAKLPGWVSVVYDLNPMVGVIGGFRWALLGTGGFPVVQVAMSAGLVGLVLVGGLFYFRRMEKTFADVV